MLRGLPMEESLGLPGGTLVITHGHAAGAAKKRHERLRRMYRGARAIAYGHSHRLICDRDEIPWVLNPGSAGRSRTFGGPSCLVLTAREKRWDVEPVRFPEIRV
jgi:predicted phosphodiesterase